MIIDSVEERVLQSFLIPVAILIEDEDFTRGWIAEAKIGVEHVDFPHEVSLNLFSIDLFQVANVNIVSLNLTKQGSLMEDNLFGMGQKLCVPAEVFHGGQFPRRLHAHQE